MALVLSSRLSWRLTVPRRRWLGLDLQVEAWNNEGGGVKFMGFINDGGTLTPLFEQNLQRWAREGDPKWFPIQVSLAKFEGREVELVFATGTAPDGKGEDRRHDLPLWGIPEIIAR